MMELICKYEPFGQEVIAVSDAQVTVKARGPLVFNEVCPKNNKINLIMSIARLTSDSFAKFELSSLLSFTHYFSFYNLE